MKKEKEFPVYPPLFFVRAATRLRQMFLKLHRRFTHPNVVMWEMVHNFWLAAGIGVAAELGLADLLKKGPMPISGLAEITGTHEASLYRVMRMLSAQGIFRETRERKFASTPLAKSLEEEQIRYLVLLHLTPRHFQMFGDLLTTVKTGKSSSRNLTGSQLFDHIGSDRLRNERFNRAMTSASRMQVSTLISVFPFEKYRTMIDVGGGEGLFLATLLGQTRENRGIVFDLPNALVRAGEVIAGHKLEGRMEAVGGDFFKEVPGGGDLYIMKNVLHDWDDEFSLKILQNVHRAMAGHARLLVIDAVIGMDNKPSFGKMTDILMMVSAGGKERTKPEFDGLLKMAGFRIRKIYPTISPHSLLEVEKIFH
ncbi:MAG: methyltransferase [Bacteroidota bacterium]